MHRFRLFEIVLAALAGVVVGLPALAQTWGLTEDDGGAAAFVCPVGAPATDDFLCFRLECAVLDPLHFTLEVAGRGTVPDSLAVQVGVDGGDVGVLNFTPREGAPYTRLIAAFDPRLHEDLVDLLQRGRRASLTLDWGTGPEQVPVGLTGSADSLYTVMNTCPRPALPVDDPGSLVLDEVVADCAELGGTVALEPGFQRREDLDGDGREDLVIDYAAAACSEAATLNCGSGGCTVGFFLARDAGYTRMFADVVRGYEVLPGGFLALDLHGTACGLYGFEACRKVFDVAGDAPVLVEEIGGPDAEAMAVAGAQDAAVEPAPEPAAEPTAVVVAVTEGLEVAPEATGPADAAPETTIAGVEIADEAAEEAAEEASVEAPEEAPVETPAETQRAAAPDPAATLAVEDEAVATAVIEGAAEADAMTVAAVAAASPVPEASAPNADEGTEEAPAAASQDDDGPTSRHNAGPAPAVSQTAEWRGDGTMVMPEVALQ